MRAATINNRKNIILSIDLTAAFADAGTAAWVSCALAKTASEAVFEGRRAAAGGEATGEEVGAGGGDSSAVEATAGEDEESVGEGRCGAGD